MDQSKKIIIDFEFVTSHSLEAIEQTKKAITELKTRRAILAAQNKQDTKEYALLDASLKNLNQTLKEQQKCLQNDLKAIEENDGSLKGMKTQLQSLITVYENLTSTERESVTGRDMSAKIRELTGEVQKLESQTNNLKSANGVFETAFNPTPLKTQLRELTMELQNLTFQQRALKEEMSQTSDPQALAEMEKKYNDLGVAIADTSQKAGQLSDTIGDSSKMIRTLAEDHPKLKAMQDGVAVLTDSFTILKGSMSAMGLESEGLMETFAKLQIIQQQVNAMYRLSNALQKEGAIGMALMNMQTKLANSSFMQLANAKRLDAAATTKDIIASNALTVAQKAATIATKGLSAALKVVPVLGWIATAVSVISSLVSIFRSAKQEAEDFTQAMNITFDVMSDIEKKYIDLRSSLMAMKDAIYECADGSKEQEYWVKQIAQQTGINYDYLLKHLDILPQIIEDYTRLSLAQDKFKEGLGMGSEIEAFARKLQQFREEFYSISGKNDKEYLNNIKNFLNGITDEVVKSSSAYKYLRDMANKGYISLDNINGLLKTMQRMTKEDIDDMRKRQQELIDEGKQGINENGKNIQETIDESKKEAEKASGTVARRVTTDQRTAEKQVETLWKTLYNQTLPQILKNFDKQTADALKDIPKDLQGIFNAQRTLARQNVIDEYLTQSRSTAVKLLNDLKAIYREIRNLKGIRELELDPSMVFEREEFASQDRKAIADMMNQIISIIASYEPDVRNEMMDVFFGAFDGEKFKEYFSKMLEGGLDENQIKEFQDKFLNSFQNLSSYDQFLDFLGKFDVATKSLAEIIASLTFNGEDLNLSFVNQMSSIQTSIGTMIKIKETVRDIIGPLRTMMKDIDDFEDKLSKETSGLTGELNRLLTTIYNTFSGDLAVKIQVVTDEYSLKQAELELEFFKAKLQSILTLDETTKASLGESYLDMLTSAQNDVIRTEMNISRIRRKMRDDDLERTEQYEAQKQELALQTSQTVTGAMVSAMSGLSQLFNQLAEKDERMAAFSKAFAMAQVLASAAASIAGAVAAAVQAGGFTGPAAPVTIPAFIMELTGIVASSLANAYSILGRVEAPKFAFGGPIEGVGGPMTDNIPIMASPGEYMMRASAVNKYGKDYFDALNAGLVTSEGTDIVGALREVIEDMPNPVVSVKEINRMQSRVRVKEQISRS